MSNELTPWIDYDLATAAEIVDEEKRKAAAADVQWLKIQPGEAVVRILPPKAAWLEWYQERGVKPDPFFPYWKHFYERPDEPGVWVSVVCPRRMEGKECPVCKVVAQLRASGSDVDKDLAYTMDARHRCLVNVIDRDDESAGPKVWDMSYPYSKWTGRSMYEKVRALMVGRAARNIVTPTAKGYDIVITREGSGMKGTTYTFQVDVDPRPLHTDMEVMKAWIEGQPDLPSMVAATPLDTIFERMGTTVSVSKTDAIEGHAPPPSDEDVLDTTGGFDDDQIPF